MDTKKLDYYEHTFITMLETVEFSLDKQEDGLYRLIDDREGYFGDESNELSDIATPSQALERLGTFLEVYYFQDLEIAFNDEYDFALSKEKVPATAKGWVKLMDEYPAFKTEYQHEYDVMDMLAHPKDVNLISLDNVVRYFYPEEVKDQQELIEDPEDLYLQRLYAKEIADNVMAFERQLPSNMQFKEYNFVEGGHTLYWITQEFFSEADLRDFQKVFKEFGKDLAVEKACVTVRDLSTYNFDKDNAYGVFAVVTQDTIDAKDYLQNETTQHQMPNLNRLDQLKAYDKYKDGWIKDHISNEVMEATEHIYWEDFGYKMTFDEYVQEFGFANGEVYAGFNEFLSNEYKAFGEDKTTRNKSVAMERD